MNSTSYMDKKIMDLSQGSSSSPKTKDFIDLMTHNNNNNALHNYHRHEDDEDEDQSLGHGGTVNGLSNKDEILASYDFQPIRPVAGSSSHSQPSSFDIAGSARAWNSMESKPNTASPIRNYSSLDSLEPAKFVLEKEQSAFDSAIIVEIDKTMKKHADNLMHALDGVSARLTQLETRTRHLESSVDDLKVSAGNNHGITDGRIRQLEVILREVQCGVQVMKDKQDIVEAQLQLAKLQVSKADHHQETQSQNTAAPVDSVLTAAASAPQQPHQQLPPPPPINTAPSHAPFSSPNAPPQPVPQHNLPPTVQLPSQFPQTQIPPIPSRDPYFPAPSQTQEPPNQQYQMPPSQQQLPPPVLPPQQQFQPNPRPQFSQPPPPQPPQQHPSQLQPQLSHHSEEPSYVPPQTYPPPNLRQPPAQPPSGPPPSQQFYGVPPSHVYDQPPPSSRPSSGFVPGYGPPPGLNEPYHYGGSPSQYGSLSGMKPQQLSSPTGSQSSGSGGYTQLPTARTLPHAMPTASAVGGGSGSSGTGNRVPIDDVIDKVTTMGFPRDHVRATVRKLTENGQSVDLNIVLDKLMNEGDGQPPRSWFSR